MPRRGTKRKTDGALLRGDLAAVHELAHRLRTSLITDMAELAWENEASGLGCLQSVAVVAAGLIEIEVKTGEIMREAC